FVQRAGDVHPGIGGDEQEPLAFEGDQIAIERRGPLRAHVVAERGVDHQAGEERLERRGAHAATSTRWDGTGCQRCQASRRAVSSWARRSPPISTNQEPSISNVTPPRFGQRGRQWRSSSQTGSGSGPEWASRYQPSCSMPLATWISTTFARSSSASRRNGSVRWFLALQ